MKIRNAVLFAAVAACSVAAHAANPFIRDVNNQVSVQAISTDVDYKEKDGSGTVLDTEKGGVPGFAISVSLMRDVIVRDAYFNFTYNRANGHTDYVGSYIGGGSYGSVKASSSATLTDYAVRFGKGFDLHPKVMLTPYVEFGHREWSRGVNEGENYTHNHYGLGALLQGTPVDRLVLTANALIGRTTSSNIDVAGPAGFSGALGNSTLYKVGLSADYAFTKNIHGVVGVDYAAFKYGRSANYSTPYGRFYEPSSDTSTTTVRAGLGWSF